MTVNLAY